MTQYRSDVLNAMRNPSPTVARAVRTTPVRCARDECWSDSAAVAYSTITQLLLLRPKTSGEYISSALAGGTTNVPGVVARATYEYR